MNKYCTKKSERWFCFIIVFIHWWCADYSRFTIHFVFLHVLQSSNVSCCCCWFCPWKRKEKKTSSVISFQINLRGQIYFSKIKIVYRVLHCINCLHAKQNNDLNDSIIIIKSKYMYCEIEDVSRWCRLFLLTTISCHIYYYWPRSIYPKPIRTYQV